MEGNFNRHLGSKLRMRRLALGLTQTKVAEAINVTFQQIQKYEKGTNGISSLRLMQLASFLKVSVMYFFDDYSSVFHISQFDRKNLVLKHISRETIRTPARFYVSIFESTGEYTLEKY